MTWQPIATAPKGVPILVCAPKTEFSPTLVTAAEIREWGDRLEYEPVGLSGRDWDWDWWDTPTYWMPLPIPPESTP
jgi:hypothetical protein